MNASNRLALDPSLEALCFTPENQHLDRKSARITPARLAKHVIAFANAEGGLLAIGIEDDGTVSGFRQPDTTPLDDFRTYFTESNRSWPPLHLEIRPVRNHLGNRDQILLMHVAACPGRILKTEQGRIVVRTGDASCTLSNRKIPGLLLKKMCTQLRLFRHRFQRGCQPHPLAGSLSESAEDVHSFSSL